MWHWLLKGFTFLAASALALCAGLPAAAQQTPSAGFDSGTSSSPTASSASWILGIARFEEEGSGGGNSRVFFGAILPRLVMESLPVLPDRPPPAPASPPESSAADTQILLFAAGKELAKALDEAARIELDPDMDEARRAAELRTVNIRIETARARIQDLKGENPLSGLLRGLGLSSPGSGTGTGSGGAGTVSGAEVSTTTSTTVAAAAKAASASLWWKGASSGVLPELDSEGPAKTAAAERLDGLVFGSVRREGDDIAVTVKGYEKASGKVTLLYTGKTTARRPQEVCPGIAAAIEEWIADRPLARLDLRVKPSDALLDIDGVDPGGTNRRLFFYSPAKLSVVARAEGYRTYRTTVDIAPGEDKTLAIDLVPLAGSGKDKKTEAALDPGMMKILDEGAGKGYAPTFASKKDRFYSALGFFVGSIPFTVLAGGNFSLYAEAATRTSDSRIVTGYTVSGAVLGVGIVATAVFAVNTIIRLVDFLGAAQ